MCKIFASKLLNVPRILCSDSKAILLSWPRQPWLCWWWGPASTAPFLWLVFLLVTKKNKNGLITKLASNRQLNNQPTRVAVGPYRWKPVLIYSTYIYLLHIQLKSDWPTIKREKFNLQQEFSLNF